VLLRITRFRDFVYRPEFYITRKQNVSETRSVSASRRGEGDAYSVGSLRKSKLQPLVLLAPGPAEYTSYPLAVEMHDRGHAMKQSSPLQS
jgi:hypothetical protein